ncbi:TrkH family potassium uptake protein [Metamycoplasma buccale]|uniref:TrkH family potassium uptake protein n=1 Tax=Metamycoplasma buccale TaxID=55602 RepID=UPI00398E61AF
MKRAEKKVKGANNFFSRFKKFGTIKYILLIYVLFTVVMSLLLLWPITHNKDKMAQLKFNYGDAIFIASSAFSNTGLSTFPIADAFNEFGQAIIAICILAGGFGIFTIKVYIVQTIFGLKATIFNSKVTQVERGNNTWGDTKKLIKVSITILLITLIISSIIFTIIFYTSPYGKFDDTKAASINNENIFNPYDYQKYNPYHNFNRSIKYAIFHSISALNNAGFDIMGTKNLAPFYSDFSIQIFTLILIFIGGVGYPVIYDVYCKLKSLKKTEPRHRFSLFTKLTLITYLSVTIIGLTFTLIFELSNKNPNAFWNQPSYGSPFEKLFAMYFQTKSTRSAGFSTIDYHHFTKQTILIHSILMFIGFSPVSTAGGIRNITIAIIFLSIITMLRGRKSIIAFKRQIGKETLIKATTIFAIGIFLVFIGTLIAYSVTTLETYKSGTNELDLTKKQYDFIDVLFEICSAFGNAGLSTGITTKITTSMKLMLIVYMFIGQFGIQQTILFWGNTHKKAEHYHYIYEDVAIG